MFCCCCGCQLLFYICYKDTLKVPSVSSPGSSSSSSQYSAISESKRFNISIEESCGRRSHGSAVEMEGDSFDEYKSSSCPDTYLEKKDEQENPKKTERHLKKKHSKKSGRSSGKPLEDITDIGNNNLSGRPKVRDRIANCMPQW